MKRLSTLIGESEESTRKIVAKLEDLSGYPSEDVRLLSYIAQKTNNKISSLGFDPQDTKSEELLEALKSKCAKDLGSVSRALGVTDDNVNNRVVEAIEQNLDLEKVLAIKCSSIKKVLKVQLPKKVMKQLKYRSIDSMLKREDVRGIVALAQVLESELWNSKFSHKLGSLKSVDYEMRPITLLDLTGDKYGTTDYLHSPVTCTPLMAAIQLWSNNISKDLSPSLILLALQRQDEIKAESEYLSSQQFKPDFSKIAERLFIAFQPQYLYINKQPVLDVVGLNQMRRRDNKPGAYDKFITLHPSLLWWKDGVGLAHQAQHTVSFHLSDAINSLLGKSPIGQNSYYHFSQNLKQDLLRQYSSFEGVKNYIRDQFDDTLIALEEFSKPLHTAPVYQEAHI
jgi:hypothetical protein